jgi:hemolysin III
MADASLVKFYPKNEERLNIASHALAAILSVIGLVFLLEKSISSGNSKAIISFALYGASLIILYSSSTLYHASQNIEHRAKLKVLDHAAIYILIAGSYTPFTLVTLEGTTGWVLFTVVWSLAGAGVILKLFFTGRFSLLSTSMYVLMGWLVVFVVKPMMANIEQAGLLWLLAGGISYTVGAVLYSIKKLPFNHAIFHACVVLGSICQFITVYYYIAI